MSSPARIIHDQPALTYGGLTAFIDDIETSWSHMLASREYYQVDGEAHEWTKRESIKVSFTLHFLNTIAPNQYPQNWSKWRQALLRGDARTLKHPEIGSFYARPVDVSYTITSKSTAGVVVKASFVESISAADDPSKLTTNASGAMAQAASDADFAMAELGLDYPDGMPEGTFEEFVGAIASIGSTLETEIAGKMAQLQGLVDSVYNAVQQTAKLQQFADAAIKDALAGSPLRWALEAALNQMRAAAQDAIDTIARGARKTVVFKTTRPMSMAAISFEIGADIADMIRLNTGLLRSPLIDSNTNVLYYASA